MHCLSFSAAAYFYEDCTKLKEGCIQWDFFYLAHISLIKNFKITRKWTKRESEMHWRFFFVLNFLDFAPFFQARYVIWQNLQFSWNRLFQKWPLEFAKYAVWLTHNHKMYNVLNDPAQKYKQNQDAVSFMRWISDQNRNPYKLAYYIQLSYFYSIKIAKLYAIGYLIWFLFWSEIHLKSLNDTTLESSHRSRNI